MLCDVQVAVLVFNQNGRLSQYSSGEMDALMDRFTDVENPFEKSQNSDVRVCAASVVALPPPRQPRAAGR